MSIKIEEPTSIKTERGERFSHPAFGQIRVSKVHGGRILYGSDFQHQSYVGIEICHSVLERNLARDWRYAQDSIIRIEMSEAQWATFVSSHGMGEGTPCTIARLGRESVPGLPPRTEDDAFKNEVREKVQKSIDGLKALKAELDAMGLTGKARGQLRGALEHVILELGSNLPFVADSFDEHVEKKIEAAKVELHGYMNGILQRAGIEALVGRELPLTMIEGPKSEDTN